MSEEFFQNALRESLEEVLEKMFFVRPLDEIQADAGSREAGLCAHLTFEGDPSGSLTLRISAAGARSISSDFLGAEEAELSAAEIGDVVCELANIICGSLLSRVESSTTFRLASPKLAPPGVEAAVNPDQNYAIKIANGAVGVAVHMDRQIWITAGKSAY